MTSLLYFFFFFLSESNIPQNVPVKGSYYYYYYFVKHVKKGIIRTTSSKTGIAESAIKLAKQPQYSYKKILIAGGQMQRQKWAWEGWNLEVMDMPKSLLEMTSSFFFVISNGF